MAEKKTGAAKHSADYRKRKKAEAASLGIEKLFFNMPAGAKRAIAGELKRLGYSQEQELWQDLVLSWIAQNHAERARRLEKPDAPAFYISPKLARKFESESMAKLKRDPGAEIIPPDL